MLRVGKNSDFVGNPLWTEVHEIFVRCRKPPCIPCPRQLSIACFIQKILAIKIRSRRKTERIYTFWPQFFGRDDPDFCMAIFSAIYSIAFGKVWKFG